MPRLQVYLPDHLHRELKARGLPASELLQAAVRAEIRRQDLLVETDRYLAALVEEVGQPTDEELAVAEAVVERVARRTERQAG